MKGHQPHTWQRIKKAGWGGSWARVRLDVGGVLESDPNMPGGEGPARQIVRGKRFLAEGLGVETEEIWLLDFFGNTADFPQLAKLAGIRWFLTQKLSWKQSGRTLPRAPHSRTRRRTWARAASPARCCRARMSGARSPRGSR